MSHCGKASLFLRSQRLMYLGPTDVELISWTVSTITVLDLSRLAKLSGNV